MSKIGRKPIDLGSVKVEIKDNTISLKGKLAQLTHELDKLLKVEILENKLFISPKKVVRDINRIWGLHRALIANKIKGADAGFEKKLKINGLGFKAVLNANNLQFSLGYSHKINFELPKDVKVEIDKTGQLLSCKSPYKDLLGQVCSDIRALRPPEPYKGTGIQYENEVIIRKAGKAKT